MAARAIVEDLLDNAGLVEPRQIVNRTVDSLDDDELRDALRETMTPFVRSVIADRRATHGKKPAQKVPAGAGASVKHLMYRQWRQKLQDPMSTAEGRKPLGKCTVDDFQFIIDRYEDTAARNMNRANFYRRYQKEMLNQGVDVFEDLDDATKKRLLDGP